MAEDSNNFYPVVPHGPLDTFYSADCSSCETEGWALSNVSRPSVPTAYEVDDSQANGPMPTRGEWDILAYYAYSSDRKVTCSSPKDYRLSIDSGREHTYQYGGATSGHL